jgi:hypothetical protein
VAFESAVSNSKSIVGAEATAPEGGAVFGFTAVGALALTAAVLIAAFVAALLFFELLAISASDCYLNLRASLIQFVQFV